MTTPADPPRRPDRLDLLVVAFAAGVLAVALKVALAAAEGWLSLFGYGRG